MGAASGTPAALAGSSANNFQTTNKNSTCVSSTKHIQGRIRGYDGRVVNAMIGMDLNKTVNGQLVRIDGGGCSGPSSRAGSGYGITVHVNYQIPANGSSPSQQADPRMTWSAEVPSNTSNIYFEAYPKGPSSQPQFGVDNLSYYGYSMQPNISIPSGGRTIPDIYLPLVRCGTLSTGALTGYFYRNGRIVNGVRVQAFSEGAASGGTPGGRGPFGFGMWSNTSGYRGYTVGKLASGGGKGQAYTVIATLADGTTKQFYQYDGVQHGGVYACKTTRLDLHF